MSRRARSSSDCAGRGIDVPGIRSGVDEVDGIKKMIGGSDRFRDDASAGLFHMSPSRLRGGGDPGHGKFFGEANDAAVAADERVRRLRSVYGRRE